MSISEIISAVGDENIQLQNLAHSLAGVNCSKKDAKVSFYTERSKGQQLAQAVALGKEPDFVALILWLPKEKLPPKAEGRTE